MAACLLFRADLGRPRPGDHRQDRRSVPRAAARDDPRGDHDRQRPRRRARLMGRGVDLRPDRQLPGRFQPVDRFLYLWHGRVLGAAPAAGAPDLTTARSIDFDHPPQVPPYMSTTSGARERHMMLKTSLLAAAFLMTSTFPANAQPQHQP